MAELVGMALLTTVWFLFPKANLFALKMFKTKAFNFQGILKFNS